MTQETKCKDLIDVFDKIGGVLSIDYDRLTCKFAPPKLLTRLSENGIGLYREDNNWIPSRLLLPSETNIKLSKDTETCESIDSLLLGLSCSGKFSEIVHFHRRNSFDDQKERFHSYQEANTSGVTFIMDITKI